MFEQTAAGAAVEEKVAMRNIRSVGSLPGTDDYLALFDYNVATLVAALKAAGVKPGA